VPHEQRECVTAWGVDSQTKRWRKRALYGGLLTENIVQALARDMMADAMLRHDAAGYAPLFTVHDEIVAEAPHEHGSLTEFIALAKIAEPWAAGCPVGFTAWEGDRYRKE
jgi:DNA polymerase